MMVTFVSQCEKNALKKTRRVLDSFANRIGNNTWQTIITQDGLNAVKKLLRKTASKNTAVSCHWIRSRSRTELVWVVGNQRKFNNEGIVPVNRTRRNILHTEWESGWKHATSIQIISVLAALLHDIGKASIGFQNKLSKENKQNHADPYRHEWISLRLFQAMTLGCETDQAWLARLANFSEFSKENPNWLEHLTNDHKKEEKSKLELMPPLAQMMSWLIVTHHRLPFMSENYLNPKTRKNLRDKYDDYLKCSLNDFYKNYLMPVNNWVKNEHTQHPHKNNFWSFNALATDSKCWQKAISRWANKALNHSPLFELAKTVISDPFIMHLSRMCLMVGDHNYSSLKPDSVKRVTADDDFICKLAANTDRESGDLKQALDEHLIGVGTFTARFARLLPQLPKELPSLINHKPFKKRTHILRFEWQNKAYDLANKLQEQTKETGFFGVNMASTGCGKTLGNARIMYGLSDNENGARFTIALGLRVLTLQTGLALRKKLHLDDTSLGILVGGTANRTLFELNQHKENANNLDLIGSESLEELVTEQIDVAESAVDAEEFGTVIADTNARKLLYTPIISCTVDHIMSATETIRGGKHIAPILRLLTSDLVLDEPDDFDQNDLPALSRLVHFAGLFGSRVLLSSATLTPDLIIGLFKAYQTGRKIWNQHNNINNTEITCAWFDEYKQTSISCKNDEDYKQAHEQYVNSRIKKLNTESARRIAKILPIDLLPPKENEEINYVSLANILLDAAQHLHGLYSEVCPTSQKTASIGLIRIANINQLIPLAQAMQQIQLTDDTQIHLCCYHARQLLLLRSALEKKLDRILSRSPQSSIFDHTEIAQAVHETQAKNHIFIVLATPVAEVGRDHDYDWAIVEPSSMRSIIQLAGRVWRHRPEKFAEQPNIYILNSNIKALKHGANLGVGDAVFTHPGFESSPKFLLNTHKINDLLTPQQLEVINSIPRIKSTEKLDTKGKLTDLEHGVMQDLLNNDEINYVNAFWKENSASPACVHLQLVSPFREQTYPETEYVYLPDEDNPNGFSFKYSDTAWKHWNDKTITDCPPVDESDFEIINLNFDIKNYIKPWLITSLFNELETLSRQLNNDNLTELALKFLTVKLNDQQEKWKFHPWLGFW